MATHQKVRQYLTEFSAEDFALDPDFQLWVTAPDAASNQFWNNFLAENPSRRKVVDEAIALVRRTGLSSNTDANAAYLEVWNNLRTNAEAAKAKRSYVLWYASAAAALVLAVSYFLFTRPGEQFPSLTYQTGNIESQRVQLVDGSTVQLNSNSKLEIFFDATSEQRKVKLTGEAYFEVAKTIDKKVFLVAMDEHSSIEVLGTEFNVMTRRKATRVFLESGSIRLRSALGNVLLVPGQVAYFDDRSNEVSISSASEETASVLTSWKSGIYVMEDITLLEIATHIEDHFGIAVAIESEELAQKKMTAKVPADDLDILIKVLSAALKVKVDKSEGKIIVSAI